MIYPKSGTNGPVLQRKRWQELWQLIVSNSSAGNWWIIEAFQSLAPEWDSCEWRLYEVLNPGCCFCPPKQTDMPPLLKELSTPMLFSFQFSSEKLQDLGIICVLLWEKLFTALSVANGYTGTNCCFLQLLKICWWVSGNRLGKQSWEGPASALSPIGSPSPGTQSSELAPCEVTLDFPPAFTRCSPPLYPSTPISGCWSPIEEGRGSQGQSLFLFGSLGLLGEAWRENGCIRAGVGGQDFNSVKEQLVWVSPHVALPSLSPQIQGDEKFVQRGTSKIKKVYGPKPLPLPCSSIREECNNVSIWPQLDWLKTRKSFLCLGVLTAGWNLIKKLKKWKGIFHSWNQRISLPYVSLSSMRNSWGWLFCQFRNPFKICASTQKSRNLIERLNVFSVIHSGHDCDWCHIHRLKMRAPCFSRKKASR